ncbi:MAG: DUF885 domain-containing protein [Bacteroidetes bacterium]|nr:DUF885 domain-containing protein [Bacteroidota bacterium]
MKIFLLIVLLIPNPGISQNNVEIQNFAKDFFNWRVITQPATGDDIPRVERPDKWIPDYSPEALAEYREKYFEFSSKLKNLSSTGWSKSDSVDYLLLHSAVERVNWELNILKLPNRNPDFYVHQTLGAVYELLLIHSPINRKRAENIILRLNSFNKTIQYAKANLNEPVNSFADIALGSLKDIKSRLYKMRDALNELFPVDLNAQLNSAVEHAVMALEDYIEWLEEEKPYMQTSFNVGREGYEYFLKNIALIPYSPEELLIMGKQEWDRSVAFDIYEKQRNKYLPDLTIFSSAEEQMETERIDEEAIRYFIEEKELFTIPDWVQHYRFVDIPLYLIPVSMGVRDDLTSETRLDEDGVRYITEPSTNMSFFNLATAKDTRPLILHEGVPGHYLQLVLSWANPDPIRRRFFDSGANEGIAFYVEELLLQYGLFDDGPRTREIIYSFMRLRALRVDVDINLAIGNYSIERAGNYLASTVPMDLQTGIQEAGFFAYNPGQAISYQIGKLQILNLIAEAKILLGEDFDLKEFHDYMLLNGNVPIALLRWEYLNLNDQIEKLWPE